MFVHFFHHMGFVHLFMMMVFVLMVVFVRHRHGFRGCLTLTRHGHISSIGSGCQSESGGNHQSE